MVNAGDVPPQPIFVLGSQDVLFQCTGDIPSKTSGQATVVYNGFLYSFGGFNDGEALNSVHALDLGKWCITSRISLQLLTGILTCYWH